MWMGPGPARGIRQSGAWMAGSDKPDKTWTPQVQVQEQAACKPK